MHFYSHLITILFPFVVVENSGDLPPSGEDFVIDYMDRQVVTYTGALLIADEG